MSDTQKQIDDWAERAAENGLSGSVTVLTETSDGRSAQHREIGEDASTEGNATHIPDDLIDHIATLLRERDRLLKAALRESIDGAIDLPSLRAACLTQAIDNIRSKLKDQANVESSGSTGRPDGGGSGAGSAEGAPQAGAEARTEESSTAAPG
jgi:hypothetical protein